MLVGDTKLPSQYNNIHSSLFPQAGDSDQNTRRLTLQIASKPATQNPPPVGGLGLGIDPPPVVPVGGLGLALRARVRSGGRPALEAPAKAQDLETPAKAKVYPPIT